MITSTQLMGAGAFVALFIAVGLAIQFLDGAILRGAKERADSAGPDTPEGVAAAGASLNDERPPRPTTAGTRHRRKHGR